jgi:hypothetical protein
MSASHELSSFFSCLQETPSIDYDFEQLHQHSPHTTFTNHFREYNPDESIVQGFPLSILAVTTMISIDIQEMHHCDFKAKLQTNMVMIETTFSIDHFVRPMI